MPDLHHEFVKRALVHTLDWPAVDRGRCLELMTRLHAQDVLSRDDLQWGALRLLGQLEDLTLDFPSVEQLAIEHLRSMVAARLLSPAFLRRCEMLRIGGAAGLPVLAAAQQVPAEEPGKGAPGGADEVSVDAEV